MGFQGLCLSEFLLSTHLPTSEGWTAELTVGLWLVVPTTGFEPMRVYLTRFETRCLNQSATPPIVPVVIQVGMTS